MARPLRIEYPGACYHVMNRGAGGENIFSQDREKGKFLEYLEKCVERFSVRIHTYCLMSNHYHLLLETPEANLSAAVHWLNGSYSTWFNIRRQRMGHVFQGRFKAIVLDADEYLRELSRYIHRNPVRAGMVESPEQYNWSSYSFFAGKKQAPDFLETDWLLSMFGRKQKKARGNYRAFVENVDDSDLENPLEQSEGGVILGGPDFVEWVKKALLAKLEDSREMPQLRRLKPRPDISKVVAAVCAETGRPRQAIIQKGGKRNMERDLAIYLARDITGASCVDLGRYFGGVGGSAIAMRYVKFQDDCNNSLKLKALSDSIRKKIMNI